MSIGFIIGTSVLNLFLALALSPLFEGCARKLRATVHSRVGPPIIQPYYDLAKLFGKEDLRASANFLVRLAPYACLISIAIAALLVPMGTFNASTQTVQSPFNNYGDSILFMYLIALSAVAVILTATASENPFAFVGASREMVMHLTVEPVLVIALVTAAINAGSLRMGDMVFWYHANGPSISMILAAIFLFLALQAQVGKLPFDIAEADQEIMGGAFIEQSGPKYALLRWSMMAKQIVFCSIFTQVFIPWPMIGNLAWDVLINMAKVFVLVLVIAVIDVVNPRLRIDQSVRYYLFLSAFSLIAIGFALVGM
jgi:formate hydrogenlyase subunit 4